MFQIAITIVGAANDTTSSTVIERVAAVADADPAAAITAVVVLLALVATGCAVVVAWLTVRKRRAAHVAAMSAAERERHDAVVEYRSRIASAEKELATATREHTSRLKASEKARVRAKADAWRTIASSRGRDGAASIASPFIAVPQGAFPLTNAVIATVDTAGNLATSSRSTLARIAAGGLLFGPVGAIVGGAAKKNSVHDLRELYLLIQGETFATLISCDPDDGPRVRQFAAAVRLATLNADGARAHHAQTIVYAEKVLAWEQRNVVPVDAARRALEAATTDTARMDAAGTAAAAEETARASDTDASSTA